MEKECVDIDGGLLRAWGLDHARVQSLSGGTANRNFLATSGGRRFFLRQRSPRYCDPNQIAFDHALMRHLAARGLKGPNPIPTQSGETFVRRDEGFYELHAFVEGDAVEWDNLDHLRAAGRTLHRFHQATATFAPPASKAWPRDDAPDRIRWGLLELRGEIHDPAALAVLDELAGWTARIEAALSDEAYWALPCQVIHGDFHPGNVLVLDDSLGLFDLDCASRQPRARDLADGILYFCARREGAFDASNITRLTRECWLDAARNRIFLDAYGPLSESERDALPWLVAARWIYSRVHGRRKLPRGAWAAYAVSGMLTPLQALTTVFEG